MTIRLVCRPLQEWEDRHDLDRRFDPFRATWSSTVNLLSTEIGHLTHRYDETLVILQIAVDEQDIRQDGWIRANARPRHSGVAISFESRFGPLRYECDQYKSWQGNVRAIALGLKALRAYERYEIGKSGQVYAGFRAIGSGFEMPEAMTKAGAITLLMNESELAYTSASDWPQYAFRIAAKKHHPDVGGDDKMMQRLIRARDLLVS